MSIGISNKTLLGDKNVKNEKSFTYLIRINIGAKNMSCIVKNNKKVPNIFLETIAKDIINKYINDSYNSINKHYRTQTSDHYYNRLSKESNFEIEDLNEIECYNLSLTFENENIVNKLD